MTFADIHCHVLYDVDDGAKNEEMMQKLIDAEYEEGVRYLCFTPHYHPGYYGYNGASSEQAFANAVEYCKKYPDMSLMLANELHYAPECLSWLKEKICHRIGHTRFVLVDFNEAEEERTIVMGLSRFINAGYIPILAHAERYGNLKVGTVKVLRQDGILVQINSGSCFGDFGVKAGVKAKKLLAKKMVDFVSTDAHDLDDRAPQFKKVYQYIEKKYGQGYAGFICRDHAVELFFDQRKEI